MSSTLRDRADYRKPRGRSLRTATRPHGHKAAVMRRFTVWHIIKHMPRTEYNKVHELKLNDVRSINAGLRHGLLYAGRYCRTLRPQDREAFSHASSFSADVYASAHTYHTRHTCNHAGTCTAVEHRPISDFNKRRLARFRRELGKAHVPAATGLSLRYCSYIVPCEIMCIASGACDIHHPGCSLCYWSSRRMLSSIPAGPMRDMVRVGLWRSGTNAWTQRFPRPSLTSPFSRDFSFCARCEQLACYDRRGLTVMNLGSECYLSQ